tara:strand:- start:2 stop:436 length:435 start_codon:yes stop_codon:yes gene_type:complete
MSIFANIENAVAPSQQRYLTDGTYRMELHKFVQGTSRRDNTPYVAVEATVLEVTNGSEASNTEGERISWVVKLKVEDTFLAAIKGFVAAAAGVDYGDVTTSMCEELSAGDGSAIGGIEVVADAKTIITLKGNPFTKVIWRPVNG